MTLAVPYIVTFISVCLYACLPVIAKKVHADIPPFSFMALTMAILSLCSFVADFFVDRHVEILKLPSSVWQGILAFGILNFLAFAAYMFAIARIPVAEYQLFYVITPIVTGLLAFAVLAEPFKANYMIGLLFIGVGLFIALRS